MINLAKLRNRKVKGIGLLELMLSLAIIAILLIMATRFYGSARRGERVNETIDVIGVVKTEAGSYWYHHNNSLTNFNSSYVVGSLPDRYKSGTDLVDGWGQKITIATSGANVTLTFTPPSLSDAQMLCARIQCVGGQPTAKGPVEYSFSVAATS